MQHVAGMGMTKIMKAEAGQAALDDPEPPFLRDGVRAEWGAVGLGDHGASPLSLTPVRSRPSACLARWARSSATTDTQCTNARRSPKPPAGPDTSDLHHRR